MDVTKQLIEELRRRLPPHFRGTAVERLTDGLFVWRAIQTHKSQRAIEHADKVFIETPKHTLIARDPFLAHYVTPRLERRQGRSRTRRVQGPRSVNPLSSPIAGPQP
jgi:hypothetical protein